MPGKARGTAGGGGKKNTRNPNTAVLKTPGKQATPVKGSMPVTKLPATKGNVRRNPSGVPTVTPLKGQGPVSRTKNTGADADRNK